MSAFGGILGLFSKPKAPVGASAVKSTRTDVLRVPSAVASYVRMTPPDVRHVGEIAASLGWLTGPDVDELLLKQKSRPGVLFCDLAVIEGALERWQADVLLEKKSVHVFIHAEFDGHPRTAEWLFQLKTAGYMCVATKVAAADW